MIIPAANIPQLRLGTAVIEAVRAGMFYVWAIRTIEEGLELLTGRPAGARGSDGQYPVGSVHRLVAHRLRPTPSSCARLLRLPARPLRPQPTGIATSGNFDHDDDPTKICNYDKITDLFSNVHVTGTTRSLSGDIAGKGKDKTVLYVWEGLRVIHIYKEDITDQDELYNKVIELKTKFNIPTSNIVLDYDGIGVGVYDPRRRGSGPRGKLQESAFPMLVQAG